MTTDEISEQDEEFLEIINDLSEEEKNAIIEYLKYFELNTREKAQKPLIEEIERLKDTINTLSDQSTMRLIRNRMRDLQNGRIKPFDKILSDSKGKE
jgi:uncharacterized protein YdaU (DUF1376 family)